MKIQRILVAAFLLWHGAVFSAGAFAKRLQEASVSEFSARQESATFHVFAEKEGLSLCGFAQAVVAALPNKLSNELCQKVTYLGGGLFCLSRVFYGRKEVCAAYARAARVFLLYAQHATTKTLAIVLYGATCFHDPDFELSHAIKHVLQVAKAFACRVGKTNEEQDALVKLIWEQVSGYVSKKTQEVRL